MKNLSRKGIFVFSIFLVFIFSCSKDSDSNELNPIIQPTLTTTTTSAITSTTASSGGTISNDGGASITSRGVVWSTNSNPTITLSTKTIDGIGTGIFSSDITGLTANTTYYIRAYATNSSGTAYGNEVSFMTSTSSVTDVDGNVYKTVTICNQTWTKTNLNVSKYRNGDDIPQVTEIAQWNTLTTGAWCYYKSSNGTTYGKLYNWYAVTDPRGLSPVGYHIPSQSEWTVLMDCLGGWKVAGGKMKETGWTHWSYPNIGATNSSGFTGLPGGYRDYYESFQGMGAISYFWSTTPINSGGASLWSLSWDYSYLSESYGGYYGGFGGFSVRCIRD